MPFIPNNQYGKHSSRKGVPNRRTSEIRQTIADLLHKELSNIDQLKKGLTNKEWLDFLIKLAPYGIPRLTESSVMVETEAPNEPQGFEIKDAIDVLQETDGDVRAVVDRLMTGKKNL
jgi:hypothetical protein